MSQDEFRCVLTLAIAEKGIDGVLGEMILVCQIEARSLEGVKGREAEREAWKARAWNLRAYKTMARRVERRES